MMILYWMRLFPSLAFYMTMIKQTCIDIGWFMVMFIMCIGVFANASYALNQIKPESVDG